MKYCSACKVHVNEDTLLCPLCKKELEKEDKSFEKDNYPKLIASPSSYKFIKRLLIFTSILGSVISIIVNFLLDSSFLWCLVVITGIIYFWVSISNVIRTNTNVAFKILFQVVCASLLVTALDYETGGYGWALNFVVPGIICFGIIAVLLLIFFNRTNWARYVLYQSILAFFGFLPFLLYLTGLSHTLYLSILTSVLAFISLTLTIVFGDKTIKNEFKRRIHF